VSAILAIDPGTEQSAWVTYDQASHAVLRKAIEPNPDLLKRIRHNGLDRSHALLAVEMVQSFGMPVGQEVFETVLWTGRFVEAWGGPWTKVYRKDVKLHLCRTTRAKDSNVRQAILDRFPRTGGGKTPQVGVKANPGPLYGCKSHLWSALGIALTAAHEQEGER
jgi:hypothetical protein